MFCLDIPRTCLEGAGKVSQWYFREFQSCSDVCGVVSFCPIHIPFEFRQFWLNWIQGKQMFITRSWFIYEVSWKDCVTLSIHWREIWALSSILHKYKKYMAKSVVACWLVQGLSSSVYISSKVVNLKVLPSLCMMDWNLTLFIFIMIHSGRIKSLKICWF